MRTLCQSMSTKSNGGQLLILENKSVATSPHIEKLIYLDELTKIPNRRYFNKRFPSLWKECEKKGRTLSLLMIDIDKFKQINDTYGHETGDEVLKKATLIMKKVLRDYGILIRFAGDEFIIILLGGNELSAKNFADLLVRRVNNSPLDIPQLPKDYRISLSVGVACFPYHTKKEEELFEKADQALYLSKDAGRNRATIYNHELALKLLAQKKTLNIPCGILLQREDIINSIINMCERDSELFGIPHFLFGPLGIGKTSLLKTIESMPQVKEKFEIINILCFPHFYHHPFKVIVQILEQLIGQDANFLKELPQDRLSKLAVVMPGIKKFFQDKSFKSSKINRDELELILKDTISMILNKKDVLVSLDEIQWCDEDSIKIIEEKLCDDSNSSLFFIGTLTGPLSDLSLTEKMPILIEKKKYKTCELKPLDMDGTAQMLSLIFKDMAFTHDIVDAVFSRSNGNPLFIEEMLRFMQQKGIILFKNEKWTLKKDWEELTPFELNDLVLERIESLDSSIIEVLSHASIVGQNFAIETIHKLEGINEGEVTEFLEKAKKADLLIEEKQEGKESYSFINPGILEALSRITPKEEKKALHKRIAEIEQTTKQENLWQNLGMILYHYKMAEQYSQIPAFLDKLSISSDSPLLSRDLKELLEKGLPKKEWGKEEKLSDEELKKALDALKYIRIAFQIIKLYPQESEMVQNSAQKVYSKINTILNKSDMLTFSLAQDTILVNGIKPSHKDYEKSKGPVVKELMTRLGFKGISFKKGLSFNELKNFLLLLANKQEEIKEQHQWDEILREEGISHVILDHRVYVAVGERDIEKAEKGIVIEDATDQQTTQISIKDIEVLKQFINQGGEITDKNLPEALSKEKIEKLISLLEEMVTNVKAGTPTLQNLQIVDDNKILDEEILDPLLKDLNLYLEELTSENKEKALRATYNLIKAGDKAVDDIINFITKSDDFRARKSALIVLMKINPDNLFKLAQEMEKHHGVDVPRKILSILYDIDHPAVRKIFNLGLYHPDSRVNLEAIIALERIDKKWCHELLVDYLKKGISNQSIRAIATVGKMKIKEAVPYLIRYLRKKKKKKEDQILLESEICKALGSIGDPEAVGLLINVASPYPFWKAKRKKDERIRISAIWALGEIGEKNKKVINLLTRISKEKNFRLRDAALSALKKISSRKS